MDGRLQSIALSPDGKTAVVCAVSGTFIIDVEKRRQTRTLGGFYRVYVLSNTWLLVADREALNALNLTTGRYSRSLPIDASNRIVVCNDPFTVMTAGANEHPNKGTVNSWWESVVHVI